ncbi:MAG: SBBP repeat-containing protein [Sphingobacteriaceae bacterium]|jgi:hypothetical protein
MIKKIFTLISFIFLINNSNVNAQTPLWQWARGAGYTGADQALATAIDASGNVYTIGWYTSANITFGSITLTNPGVATSDVFVTKHDAAGNAVWAKTFGGSDGEIGNSIAVDASGNVYITGWYTSTTVAMGTSTLTNTSAGSSDIFLAKLSSAGNVLWAKNIGGTSADRCNGITLDASGNIFATGCFMSATVNFGANTLTNNGTGTNDFFISKFDANGTNLWAKSAGGNNADIGNGIAVDSLGNAYATGMFTSASINFGTSAISNSGIGTQEFFLVKYDGTGNAVWTVKGNGSTEDYGNAVEVSKNAVYVTGGFNSPSLMIGTTTLSNPGASTHDVFLAKYDLNGNFAWANRSGDVDSEVGNAIDSDNLGRIFISGYFTSSSISFGGSNLTNVMAGYRDLFIAAYDASGTNVWATSVGDAFDESANSISVNSSGSEIYVLGVYNSTSLSFGTHSVYKGCGDDVFLAKLSGLTIGISENKLSNGIQLYPNPAKQSFYLNSKYQGNFELINSIGKQVLKQEITEGLNSIDVSTLEPGLYILKQFHNGSVYQTKLIID